MAEEVDPILAQLNGKTEQAGNEDPILAQLNGQKKSPAGNVSSTPAAQPTVPSTQNGYEPNFFERTLDYLGIAPIDYNAKNEALRKEQVQKNAVEASKKTAYSVTELQTAQKKLQTASNDLAAGQSWDKLRATENPFGLSESVAIYDDQSGKYVPKDAFETNKDGNVQSKYSPSQLSEFDRVYRNSQKELLEAPEKVAEKRVQQQAAVGNSAKEVAAAAEKYKTNFEEQKQTYQALYELDKKPLSEYGIGDAFMEGMANTNAAVKLTLTAPQASDEDLINQLEGYYLNQSMTEKPQGLQYTASEMIGGQVVPLTATIGASLATGGVGGAATAIATSSAQGYGNNLMQGYAQARQQGQDPMQALTTAKDYAKFGAGTGAIEGGVGFINPFLKTGGLANKTLVQGVKSALVDAGIDGTVAMGMQIANNQYGQSLGLETNTLDGVLDQGAGEVAFSLGINALFGGAGKLAPKIHQQITFGLANSDVPSIQQAVDEAVKAGVVDASRGQEVMNEVISTNKAIKKMPEDLTEQEKFDLTPKMKEKDALVKQLEAADDAFKPAIEAKVEALNREIQEETGAPLTLKEQKAYEKLQERKSDSEKPLLPSEKAELKHYEAREKAAEKRAEQVVEQELEPTITETENTVTDETSVTPSQGTDATPTTVLQEGTGEQTAAEPTTMDTATPNAEQVGTDTPQVEADATMGTGEAVPVDAASIFEEHSNKRGNFAKDKVLEKMGGLKDKAIAITDNFDSMIADLQARADKGEVAFRIDC